VTTKAKETAAEYEKAKKILQEAEQARRRTRLATGGAVGTAAIAGPAAYYASKAPREQKMAMESLKVLQSPNG
jgi:hypothetical protein